MQRSNSVEEYIQKHPQWTIELSLLRKLMLNAQLEETIKWGAPVYTLKGKNIVGLGAFKSYVGIWFFQGALLKDTRSVLVNAQEGKTQAMRQWRFNRPEEIDESLVHQYIKEAIRNQEEGKEIKPEKNKPLVIPQELVTIFKERPEIKASFETLTLSQQRDYTEHIATAKREETKVKRLEKIIPMILEQKGLNDKYKKN